MRSKGNRDSEFYSTLRQTNLGMARFRFFLASYCFLLAGLTISCSENSQNKNIVALVNAKIHPSASSEAINNGTILIEDGKISSIGESGTIKVPSGASVIDCKGLYVLPGFWNSHVHFNNPRLENARNIPANQLEGYLKDMLTRYGVTHVFDIGSYIDNTVAIRQRIDSGEINGPSIRTVGTTYAPPEGNPFYLTAINVTLPQLNSASEATKSVNEMFDKGADGVKLFVGSPVQMGKVVLMPIETAAAACSTAHAKGKPVFAHPTSTSGIRVAIESGVDILAHTAPDDQPWDKNLIDQMLAVNLYLIPTIKLWKWEAERMNIDSAVKEQFINEGINQLSAYKKAGGKILFGTDIDYMSDYDPTDEYVYMTKAGMSFKEILRSMTMEPAEKFKASSQTGKLELGMDADIVILKADPEKDIKNLAQVKYTIRKGKIIYTE